MKGWMLWIYIMIGLGAGMTAASMAKERVPNDVGFQMFMFGVGVVAWPMFIGGTIVGNTENIEAMK